jgi:hypothetical protein
MITHPEVLAAIDKARDPAPGLSDSKDEHLDDLRATAERHAPTDGFAWDEDTGPHCLGCTATTAGHRITVDWPCPDYQQVVDRLTGWNVL